MARIPNAARFLVDTGLLGEINRVVLHPRGLALAVSHSTSYGPDGKVTTVAFSDSLIATDDPEGIDFGPDAAADIAGRLRAAERDGLLRPVSDDRRALYPPDGIETTPEVDHG